jgi:cytochrome c oxidase subunit 2
MALAIALILIVVGSVVFHFVSPWWFTPIASNWAQLDDTIFVTLVITGVVFVVVNVFIAWSVVRFHHRPGRKAAFEPENRRLEGWLTVATTVGIVAMLAPGLYVYSDMISPPRDAAVVEALGQQWQWRFRFPGADGLLGLSETRFVSNDNPFGVNPDDPNGQDDVLVDNAELRLPLDRPVKVLLRSRDVLHNFYVPQFRAKMDLVPGMVTSFWVRPTRAGRFEILCAELCGVGHSNMRGIVVVEDEAAFETWLAAQPTFAKSLAGDAAVVDAAQRGRMLAQTRGCQACHSADGSRGVGPTWQGLYGSTRSLADGRSVIADDAYLTQSIREPAAAIVQGYPPVMPPANLDEAEIAALIAYIRSLAAPPAASDAPARAAQQ